MADRALNLKIVTHMLASDGYQRIAAIPCDQPVITAAAVDNIAELSRRQGIVESGADYIFHEVAYRCPHRMYSVPKRFSWKVTADVT